MSRRLVGIRGAYHSDGKGMVLFCLAAVFLLWAASGILFSWLTENYGGIERIRLDSGREAAASLEGSIKEKWWEAAEKDMELSEIPLSTLWTMEADTVFCEPVTGRSATGDVLYFSGDNQAGFQLVLENGCVLTEEMAFQIWGTDRVIGQEVEVDGRRYVVERIIQSWGESSWSGNAAVARWTVQQGEQASPMGGDGLETGKPSQAAIPSFDVLDVGSKGAGASASEELLRSLNLSGAVSVDFDERLASLLAVQRLPLWVAAAGAAVWLLRKSKAESVKWKRSRELFQKRPCWDPGAESILMRSRRGAGAAMLMYVSFAAMLLCGAAALAGLPFYIPSHFLPTVWSDFSFWTDALDSAMQWDRRLGTMGSYGPDRAFAQGAKVIKIITGVQICLLGAGYLRLRRKGEALWQRLK